MIKTSFRLPGLAVAGTILVAGAADAQQVISRTSDYTVTWSDAAFSNAGALYAASYAYGASAFAPTDFPFSILPNALGFSYFSGGGVTVTSSAPAGPPYPTSATATFLGDGSAGFWGWQYNTAAGAGGSGLPLTYGRLGEDATLNFDVGGFDDSTYAPPVGYYVFVYLPGDWTTPGTSPGDYIFNSVNPGFSTPTFIYDSGTNTTTVETFTTAFVTGEPDLSFTLVGTVVPEASTWAMMLVGFAGLGFAGYRRSRSAVSIAD